MVDMFSADKRTEIMRSIRSKDTKPEMRIRKALHARGWRYRLHARGLPGTPDLVFAGRKTVVQVRGCFWHGHFCQEQRVPKTNRTYWKEKIARNQIRDRKNDRKLRSMGWSVIVVWECRCRTDAGLWREVRRIEKALGR